MQRTAAAVTERVCRALRVAHLVRVELLKRGKLAHLDEVTISRLLGRGDLLCEHLRVEVVLCQAKAKERKREGRKRWKVSGGL